jgi:hypothetical protein
MCSTCGLAAPRCELVPDVWPEPPAPTPVAGCRCEPDGAGTARVSLDCFCSLYDCPSRAEIEAECADPGLVYCRTGEDERGRFWFETGDYAGERYVYDGAELVAALRTSAGPVSEPCASYRVSAGEVSGYEPPSTDR